MKKLVFFVLVSMITIGITTNTVWAQDASAGRQFVVKDGENIVKIVTDFSNLTSLEVFHISTQNEKWEWYTPEEFEYQMKISIDPTKADGFTWRPIFGLCDLLSTSADYFAERDRAKLQQTLNDIKKGIKVSKPITILITSDGFRPLTSYTTNFVGWAHWYVYGYTFTDKAGKEVDLGIYETRDGLFNALKFYCDKEVRAGRMTKREADRMYKGIAHNVRNCDEVPLSDKLVYYKNLYDPTLFIPKK